jgi:hypothetical protein
MRGVSVRPVVAAVGIGALLVGLGPGALVTSATAEGLSSKLAPVTIRVSVGPNGAQANGSSGAAKVSKGCRYVTFASAATNIKGGGTNTVDTFLVDAVSGRRWLISKALKGKRPNGDSRPNGISRTGRFVAYDSGASNLVPHDGNHAYDVFIRDRDRFRSERISVPAEGGWANGPSYRPAVSAAGRYVAFDSYATNMIADDTSGGFDVFVRDRVERTTERASFGPGGVEANGESTGAAISSSGRFIVYESGASNLVADDSNGFVDVFIYDRVAATTELVSTGLGGAASNDVSLNADISGNGRYVAFTSRATNLVEDDDNGQSDVFVWDRIAKTTTLVSIATSGEQGADDGALYGTLSDDGSVVTFDGFASNVVPHDTNIAPDVFLHSMTSGVTRRVSVSTSGKQGNWGSIASAISGSGRCVVFTASSTNLVPHDTNGDSDILMRRFAS